MMPKATAFFLRDLRVALSYRLSFVQGLATIFLGLVSMYFVSRLVNDGEPEVLQPYGSDYFAYALVGLSSALFLQTVASQFPGAIRTAQLTGTLEVVVSSGTRAPAFLVYSSLYGVGFALFQLASILTLGAVLFGADLSVARASTAVLALALTVATFAGLGIFAAAFVLRFKQPEPFTAAVMTSSFVISGVLYPTSVLPWWLEDLAPALPLTHTMSALRGALIPAASDASLSADLAALGAFALLLPAGLIVFQYALSRAKALGTLGQY